MRFFIYFLAFFCLPFNAFAEEKILNVYAWSGEIPDKVVRQFEKETGIKVNLSTYDNNEIMYAKLRAVKNAGYDVINPSSYYVDRMRKQNMLQKLEHSQLPNEKNLNPIYTNAAYDPGLQYSIPHVSGITGIFVNTKEYATSAIQQWSDLWSPRFKNQLLLLDDTREIFSMALMTLGYSANDKNPDHIQQAFQKLKTLWPNIKVFSSETVASIIIDEDATIGMAWNGDIFKAAKENANVKFIFPQDGFVIWVDNLAIPQSAKHVNNAHLFLNFMLRADIAAEVALLSHYSTPNLAAQKLLPPEIRNNPMIYPSSDILRRGQFQIDVGEETTALFEKYWEELKMGG